MTTQNLAAALERRALAEQITGLLGQLAYLNGGLNSEPALLVRLVDGRTSEHLATAIVDAKTAQQLRFNLSAHVNGSRPPLYAVGGGI